MPLRPGEGEHGARRLAGKVWRPVWESAVTLRIARHAPGSPWQKFEGAALARGEGRINARKMVSLLEKAEKKSHKMFFMMLLAF